MVLLFCNARGEVGAIATKQSKTERQANAFHLEGPPSDSHIPGWCDVEGGTQDFTRARQVQHQGLCLGDVGDI